MTNTDVIKKLIGKITPVGESNTDEQALENLVSMCKVVENLLSDIQDVARYRVRHEASMKKAGEYAARFLNITKQMDV